MKLTVLAIHRTTGDLIHQFHTTAELTSGDALVVYGSDEGHDALEAVSEQSESAAEYAAHGHRHHE